MPGHLCLTMKPQASCWLYLPDGREIVVNSERRTSLSFVAPHDVIVSRYPLTPQQVKDWRAGRAATVIER